MNITFLITLNAETKILIVKYSQQKEIEIILPIKTILQTLDCKPAVFI
jgi:hypothetical protein